MVPVQVTLKLNIAKDSHFQRILSLSILPFVLRVPLSQPLGPEVSEEYFSLLSLCGV